MTWYKAGTVSVVQNSNAVIGTGTAFIANGRVGDGWRGPDGGWYEVTNIASDTALSIDPPYQGATNAAGNYALAPLQGYVKDSADRLRAITGQIIGVEESVEAAAASAASALASKNAAAVSEASAAASADTSGESASAAASSAGDAHADAVHVDELVAGFDTHVADKTTEFDGHAADKATELDGIVSDAQAAIDAARDAAAQSASDAAGSASTASASEIAAAASAAAAAESEGNVSNKVNVSDIVDDLVTDDPLKVLSAKQGVELRALIDAPITTLDSSATPNIGGAGSNTITITGTTGITGFTTAASGVVRTLVFAGIVTLTHNATSLILPKGESITAAAGDVLQFTSLGGGNWRCTGKMLATDGEDSGGAEWGSITGVLASQTDLQAVLTTHAGAITGLQGRGKWALVRDIKPLGSGGGTQTLGGWRTRALNTTFAGGTLDLALSTNRILLPVGTYRISITSSSFGAADTKLRLQNVTAGTTLLEGNSISYIGTSNLSLTNPSMEAIVVITTECRAEVQMWSSITRADDGMGRALNIGTSEVYTTVIVESL